MRKARLKLDNLSVKSRECAMQKPATAVHFNSDIYLHRSNAILPKTRSARRSANLEHADVVADALFLVLRNALCYPCNVPDLLS